MTPLTCIGTRADGTLCWVPTVHYCQTRYAGDANAAGKYRTLNGMTDFFGMHARSAASALYFIYWRDIAAPVRTHGLPTAGQAQPSGLAASDHLLPEVSAPRACCSLHRRTGRRLCSARSGSDLEAPSAGRCMQQISLNGINLKPCYLDAPGDKAAEPMGLPSVSTAWEVVRYSSIFPVAGRASGVSLRWEGRGNYLKTCSSPDAPPGMPAVSPSDRHTNHLATARNTPVQTFFMTRCHATRAPIIVLNGRR